MFSRVDLFRQFGIVGIMRNISVELFGIWTSGSRGDVI